MIYIFKQMIIHLAISEMKFTVEILVYFPYSVIFFSIELLIDFADFFVAVNLN